MKSFKTIFNFCPDWCDSFGWVSFVKRKVSGSIPGQGTCPFLPESFLFLRKGPVGGSSFLHYFPLPFLACGLLKCKEQNFPKTTKGAVLRHNPFNLLTIFPSISSIFASQNFHNFFSFWLLFLFFPFSPGYKSSS